MKSSGFFQRTCYSIPWSSLFNFILFYFSTDFSAGSSVGSEKTGNIVSQELRFEKGNHLIIVDDTNHSKVYL